MPWITRERPPTSLIEDRIAPSTGEQEKRLRQSDVKGFVVVPQRVFDLLGVQGSYSDPEAARRVFAAAAESFLLAAENEDSLDKAETLKEIAATLVEVYADSPIVEAARCVNRITAHYLTSFAHLDCLESAIVGTTFAEKVNDKAVMRHAYSLRGAAESNCGNPVLGATYLTHALDIAKDLDEREATSACIVNLLHTLIAQNRYREAITLGAKAESAFGDVSAEMRSLIRSNLGIAYARNGRLREALITGQKSIDELPNALTSVDIHRNGAVLAVYIRTLIDVENLAQAERRMPQLLDIAAKSSSLHLSLVIEATRALYLAMCGEVEASSAAINDALESATSDYEARRQILELAVKVHSRNGNMEAAFAADIELHNLTSASLSANLKFHVAKERTTKDKVARAVKMMGDVCVATEITEDPSGLHPHRVAELSRRIALRMGMGSDEAALIASAAHLHDLGKCAVPYSIFMNQGVLSDAERSALREHTQIGIWMIEEICPEMPQIYRDVIAFHHEWWNGTGYPGQRGNTEIPVAARITGIADCFDALTHSRPWRNPVTTGKALQQIARLSSLQFDPAVYQALHDEISEFEDNQLWIDSELSWNSNACEVTKARAKVRDFLRTL